MDFIAHINLAILIPPPVEKAEAPTIEVSTSIVTASTFQFEASVIIYPDVEENETTCINESRMSFSMFFTGSDAILIKQMIPLTTNREEIRYLNSVALISLSPLRDMARTNIAKLIDAKNVNMVIIIFIAGENAKTVARSKC